MQALYILSLCLLPCALAQVDLNSYPLQAELRPGVYTLYWGFDVEQETIRFAVRVQTLGWVGFGLSPTGGMANSDIVIGWVNGAGAGFLHDRYATGEIQPTIDPSQDWTLDGSMEDGGFTILAFSRNWVTCDDRDRDVQVETARLIFSWNEADPIADEPTNVIYHGMNNRGTISLNLLGSSQTPRDDPADIDNLNIIVENITIPTEGTTYWCSAFELPAAIVNNSRYVTKYAPVITPGNELYVHHILVYECNDLNNTHVGESGVCEGEVSNVVSGCRQGVLVAGWAVGGTEYVYPEGVAYPIGGDGAPRYLVMETHYDNPSNNAGVIDSSGLRFSHTAEEPENKAGVLQMGYFVSLAHIVPPGASSFDTFGDCNSQCTSIYFPPEGITVFSNLLHTHLAGVGVTLHHLRRLSPDNGDNCTAIEELPPIEQNPQYDFNYQQYTTLTKPIQVLPGDILRLECNYNTIGRDSVVLGGPATQDEMCLSFLNYYPRINLATCVTFPDIRDERYLRNFIAEHASLEAVIAYRNAGTRAELKAAWNLVDWTQEAIDSFEQDTRNGPVADLCISAGERDPRDQVIYPYVGSTLLANCPYEPVDKCDVNATEPIDCCTRVGGAVKITSSMMLIGLCLIVLQALF